MVRKIPNLRELNKIVQKPDYKKIGNWMARYIVREAALPLTWLFLHTPISANGVTFISLLVGLGGCFVFIGADKWSYVGGAFLLQLWYLLDHVDGQIARFYKKESITGVFFDYITHHLIHIGVFIGISWGIFLKSSNFLYIVLGALCAGGVFLLNILYDSLYKSFFHWIKNKGIYVNNKNITAFKASYSSEGKDSVKKIFSWMHKMCEIHVVMNVITLLSVLQFIFNLNLWRLFIIFYAVLIPSVSGLKIIFFIRTYKPDKEFVNFVEILKRFSNLSKEGRSTL